MNEFEWDSHNIRHILEDYPERKNTIGEVESVFNDRFLMVKEIPNSRELRFSAVGLSNLGKLKVVIYTVIGEKIRQITCWPANTQTKRVYYERAKN